MAHSGSLRRPLDRLYHFPRLQAIGVRDLPAEIGESTLIIPVENELKEKKLSCKLPRNFFWTTSIHFVADFGKW